MDDDVQIRQRIFKNIQPEQQGLQRNPSLTMSFDHPQSFGNIWSMGVPETPM